MDWNPRLHALVHSGLVQLEEMPGVMACDVRVPAGNLGNETFQNPDIFRIPSRGIHAGPFELTLEPVINPALILRRSGLDQVAFHRVLKTGKTAALMGVGNPGRSGDDHQKIIVARSVSVEGDCGQVAH